jgi:thiamine pyrophosphokinase
LKALIIEFKSIASLKIGVDGGSNYLNDSHKNPDIISGDFDSILKEKLEYYRNKGTKIIETPDQNATDFTKAVQLVFDRNNRNENKPIESIIAIWSSMGRTDQVLANIDTLYKYGLNCDNYVPIFLLQVEQSISWLLIEVSN